MMIQTLSVLGNPQNVGLAPTGTEQEKKSMQIQVNTMQKGQDKTNAVFQQAAYVVEFSNQINQMVEKDEMKQKVRALGAHSATVTAAFEDTLEYLNKTEKNLTEIEDFAKFAATDELKLTVEDREMLQKAIDAVKGELQKDDFEFQLKIGTRIDNLIGEILDAHAKNIAGGMEESQTSKDAAQRLTDMLNDKENLDWEEKFDLLDQIDGLSDEDREAARMLKEGIMEQIFSSSKKDGSQENALGDALKNVYKIRVTTQEQAMAALETIAAAKKKVQDVRSGILYDMNKKTYSTEETKSGEAQSREIMQFKKQMEEQLKKQSQLFYLAQKDQT